ncbi:MAG: S8 family serine peptidase [Pseudomonadota bacterium]
MTWSRLLLPSIRFGSFLALALVFQTTAIFAQDARAWTRLVIDKLCPAGALSGLEAQATLPGSWLLSEEHRPNDTAPALSRLRLALPDTSEISLERRARGGQLWQFRTAFFSQDGTALRPDLQAITDGTCTIQSARSVRYGEAGHIWLDQLDGDLTRLRWTETLQAPWPDGTDPGGVRVALVDSGLAYDLPLFRDRLARDSTGRPLGYDFWDLDPWPYDGDTSRGAFFPIRHGTTVASILAQEAPDAALIPYRYPRPDMSRLGELVARAEAAGARILAMPLGSTEPDDWIAFADALKRHDILAIVSAGNDGRDISERPIYPAALDLENIITVTSADAFGRLAEGSNWSRQHVDIMLPAENLDVIDFRGAKGVASGSSYAVPRLAALAARELARDPRLSTSELKARLLDRAVPSPFETERRVAVGWIADPLAD